MISNSYQPALEPDHLTLHMIATGIIKLAETVKNGQPLTLPYPQELQRGLDRLTLTCLRLKKTPPQSIPDLLLWCQKPLQEWPLQLPEEADTADKLLDDQMPTSICLEWASTGSDIEAELTQQKIVLEVMNLCKTADTPHSYTAWRNLIIKHPVLTQLELLQHCRDPLLDSLEKQIKDCYEPVTNAWAKNGYFYCCDHCNNIMFRTDKGNLICSEERCRIAKVTKEGKKIAQKQNAFCLKRGLRHFIAAPGRAELRLAEKLKKLKLQVELWPNFDSYDLRVVFPDQEAWAIDVKDWANPFLLARNLKQQDPLIKSNPPWTKAYFIFPDERRQQRTDYLRAFQNNCQLPKNIKAKFESDFIKDVKTKQKKCK